VRSLLRLKRKSDPKIDDAQDGARATLIEEGVTTWIFGQAIELDFFANTKRGDLPFDLLKHVRQFVAGYEAEQCPCGSGRRRFWRAMPRSASCASTVADVSAST
jgi:hypothetical protein